MTAPRADGNRLSVRRVLVAAVAYAVIGVGTSQLDAPIASGLRPWRYAAWVLSAVVLLLHSWRARHVSSTIRAAIEVALGAAVGGFLLALGGPVRSHWSSHDRTWSLLSMILFPAFMGVAAFIAALVLGYLSRRADRFVPRAARR
ncbi:MAG TPA: hypothetical protein VKH19_14395 [Gemmatimonadaceae bacterium]|nr:hypothetical protein [Gemmatimonadaceae bacterium]